MSPAPRPLAIAFSLATGALFALAGCEEVSVNVIDAASVEISPASVTVFEGEEEEVSAIPRSSAGDVLTGRSMEWSVDDLAVAVVSDAGVVRGEATGTTTLRVRTEGVEGSAPVTVLPRPEISLSRSSLELFAITGDENPSEEEVDVANVGGGTLSGLSLTVDAAGENADWLSASLASTEAPTTLTISASAENLAPGAYEGTVLVSSPEARNSPQAVKVELRVEEPPPIIRVAPSSVSFSSLVRSYEPATQSVLVTNVGGGDLTGLEVSIIYGDGQPTGWLSADLQDSTAPTLLDLEASARRLSAGTYTADVVVSSPLLPDGSQTVQVIFEVSYGQSTSR